METPVSADPFAPESAIAVPPSGGSLEIGNATTTAYELLTWVVPPSGGSLEIGNLYVGCPDKESAEKLFPLRGDP